MSAEVTSSSCPEREAMDPKTGDELSKLRRELPNREVLGPGEDVALRGMGLEADLEAEIEGLESSGRGAPVARGEVAKGNERFFPRAEGGLRGVRFGRSALRGDVADLVSEGVVFSGQCLEGLEKLPDAHELVVLLLPGDVATEGLTCGDPVESKLTLVPVVGHEYAVLFRREREVDEVVLTFRPTLHGTHDVPAASDESVDQRAVDVGVCVERESSGHYFLAGTVAGLAIARSSGAGCEGGLPPWRATCSLHCSSISSTSRSSAARSASISSWCS